MRGWRWDWGGGGDGGECLLRSLCVLASVWETRRHSFMRCRRGLVKHSPADVNSTRMGVMHWRSTGVIEMQALWEHRGERVSTHCLYPRICWVIYVLHSPTTASCLQWYSYIECSGSKGTYGWNRHSLDLMWMFFYLKSLVKHGRYYLVILLGSEENI